MEGNKNQQVVTHYLTRIPSECVNRPHHQRAPFKAKIAESENFAKIQNNN